MYHSPVLLPQILNLLQPQPGKVFIDATVGNGGLTIELIKRGAVVYGIDQDPANLQITLDRLTKLHLESYFHPIHGNFSLLETIIPPPIKKSLSGILFDLGLSLNQQTDRGRGFSFNDPCSLDMRLDPNQQDLTAENIINTYSFEDLYKIFTKYAQEKFSRPLIYQIINRRQKQPITTSADLANIIRKYYRQHHLKSRLDPATKIFLALRITVNDEILHLQQALQQSLKILPKLAVVCIITFNSTEDRAAKRFIQTNRSAISQETAKAITPDRVEIRSNPPSRSAKLRTFVIK